MEIQNALIKDTSLTTADHGLLSSFLTLDYGGSVQGFGGYQLYSPNIKQHPNYAGHWIWRCMEVVGVWKWEDLKGKFIRVKMKDWHRIHAIGNIIEDKWFCPSEELAIMENEYSKEREKLYELE